MILIFLLFSLFGFSNSTIDANTAEGLDQSLQRMLQPLNQDQRLKLMRAVFLVAYDGADHYKEVRERRAKSENGAWSYVSSGRMDGNVHRSDGYGTVLGWTRQESLLRFVSSYGRYVNGKSGNQLLREAAVIGVRLDGVERKHKAQTAERNRQDALRKLSEAEQIAQKQRPEWNEDFIRKQERVSFSPDIVAVSYLDAAIAQGHRYWDYLDRVAGGDSSAKEPDVRLYDRLRYYSGKGNLYSVGGRRTGIYEVPANSSLTKFLPPEVIGLGTARIPVVSESERVAKSLSLVQIQEFKNFKVFERQPWDKATLVKSQFLLSFKNPRNKPMKVIKYGVAVSLKSDPSRKEIYTHRGLFLHRDQPAKNLQGKFSLRFSGPPPSKSFEDYDITPFVISIRYYGSDEEEFFR